MAKEGVVRLFRLWYLVRCGSNDGSLTDSGVGEGGGVVRLCSLLL